MSKKMNKYFMNIAELSANNSKYPGTKVGCVLVKDGRIVSIGWNGNAPGSDDDFIFGLEREERLKFSIHAEENAILNAMNTGTSIEGAYAYVTHYPCASCASKLSSVGVNVLIYKKSDDPEFIKNWINPNIPKALNISIQECH